MVHTARRFERFKNFVHYSLLDPATRGVLKEKVYLKISENSQENTWKFLF